jgi:hypothetical protein
MRRKQMIKIAKKKVIIYFNRLTALLGAIHAVRVYQDTGLDKS